MKDGDALDWLPDLVECDWNRYQETLDRAYAVFWRDFGTEAARPTFQGKRMGLKRHPEFEGKNATFWHFVTEGKIEVARTPVRERIERIAWPKAILVEAAATPSRVIAWSNERKHSNHARSVRWLLALTDFSYVVVVDDRGEYVLPWTAYTVAEEHSRRKLRKDYNNWKSTQKS